MQRSAISGRSFVVGAALGVFVLLLVTSLVPSTSPPSARAAAPTAKSIARLSTKNSPFLDARANSQLPAFPAATRDWLQAGFMTTPTARWATPMAFDEADNVLVVAGGYNGVVSFADTWVFANGSWQNITTSLSPLPPPLDKIVYDPSIGAIVGYGSPHNSPVTWEFRHMAWKNVTSGVTPPARGRTMMTYDPTIPGVLLFGGQNPSGTALSDTWKFQGGTWTKLTPSVSPPARSRGNLAWDGHDRGDILFGGFAVYGTTDFNDTWEFAGGTWVDLSGVVAPSQRDGADMVYDPLDQAIVLFGGFFSIGGAQGTDSDTWLFASNVWTPLSPSTNPGSRALSGVAYCPPLQDLVILGGYSFGGVALSDVWTWGEPLQTGQIERNRTEGSIGAPITFNASVVGGAIPIGYAWAFGDGSTGSTPQPSHRYPTAGLFTVYLNLTDAYRSSLSLQTSVYVASIPFALGRVAYTPFEPAAGAAVVFSETPSGGLGPYQVQWSFGDGATASGVAPSHAYAAAGTYNASVNASDSYGALVTANFTVNVAASVLTVSPVGTQPSEAVVGTSEHLSAAAGGGIPPWTYAWSFGDGGMATGAAANHTYLTAGNETGALRVVDSIGANVTEGFVVRVAASSLSVSSVVASPPGAAAGSTVDLSIAATGGLKPYNITWQLGDGRTAYGAAVQHVYASAGTYHLRVSVKDDGGVGANATLTYQVAAPPSGGTTSGSYLFSANAWPIWAAVAAAAVIAAVAAALVRRSRRSSREPESPEPDDR